jgi:hypothetical protein
MKRCNCYKVIFSGIEKKVERGREGGRGGSCQKQKLKMTNSDRNTEKRNLVKGSLVLRKNLKASF